MFALGVPAATAAASGGCFGCMRLLSAGVFSLAGLRRRGVLGLRARLGERVERPVDTRPRLRSRLGEWVDPPNLRARLEQLLSRWGEP